MKTSKQLREERGLVDGEILELRNKYEGTEMSEADAKLFDEKIERMEALGNEIEAAEKRENALKAAESRVKPVTFSTQKLNEDESRGSEQFDILKAIKEIASRDGKLTGLEKEVIEEGRKEARQSLIITGDDYITIPARFMGAEKRTDISQGTSDIKPTGVGAYTDALRERAVYQQLSGINVYEGLVGDLKLPVTGAQSLGWASAENSAAADGGANFTKDTLTPFRITGYVDISNRIRVQNGEQTTTSVMRDLGRAEAALINTGMLSTATVTNAPTSLAATSGVLTFTEATFSAGVSVFSDLMVAEETLADDHGLDGDLAYVLSTNLLKQVKTAVKVAGVEAGLTRDLYNNYNANGHLTKFSTGCTKSAGVSGDGLFGDWSKVHFGRWGGMNIMVDPYTQAINDQIRLVVNSNVDWSLVQGAAFVKFTSLVA